MFAEVYSLAAVLVAALVAAKTVELLRQDDQYKVARLAFERLFVSALAQGGLKDPPWQRCEVQGQQLSAAQVAANQHRDHRLIPQLARGPTGFVLLTKPPANVVIIPAEETLRTLAGVRRRAYCRPLRW